VAVLLVLVAWAWPAVATAQQPFSTDDTDVSSCGTTHVEVFNEHDWLQPSQKPHRRQITLNMRVNYGLTDSLELDLDAPLIMIFNAAPTTPQRPFGVGDTDFGFKYNVREDHHGAHGVAVALATYIELPTGDASRSLGSGATDVWTYAALEKALTDRTTLRLNGGYLFVGNTSTGVVGITTTTRGHIATMGASIVRAMTDKLQLGVDISAAATSDVDLKRGQLQLVAGGSYELHKGFSVDVGLIGGHFPASPRAGVQFGFSLDLPRQ
jgi:Putative MetA-pathway of phenol degradation